MELKSLTVLAFVLGNWIFDRDDDIDNRVPRLNWDRRSFLSPNRTPALSGVNKGNIESVTGDAATCSSGKFSILSPCRALLVLRDEKWTEQGKKLKRKLLSRIIIVWRKLKKSRYWLCDGVFTLKISVSGGITRMCADSTDPLHRSHRAKINVLQLRRYVLVAR